METQKQTQYSEFQPSEINGILMAVIEYRNAGEHEWRVWAEYNDGHEILDGLLRRRCEDLARHYPKAEFRFRHGTLTLEPSDKCEIFKTE